MLGPCSVNDPVFIVLNIDPADNQLCLYMFDLSLASTVLVIAVAVLTTAAAITDIRWRRIPNKLTLPMFALGWLYQGAFHGLSGLLDGFLGFLIGFGILFVLWMVGGGGGGDVKLMGALSVWLGYRLTLSVMIVSTTVVILVTGGVVLWSLVTAGMGKSKTRFLATGKGYGVKANDGKRSQESTQEKQSRRVMAYAIPVAIATWSVVLWNWETLP